MPFEFAFWDWLYQFHNPVMNAISIFFLITPVLTARSGSPSPCCFCSSGAPVEAGFAMAVALVLYMAAGHFFLKPLFARPRPCDLNTSITMLVARPHGHSLPLRAHCLRGGGSLRTLAAKPEAGRTRAGAGSLYRLYPAVPLCALPPPISSAAQCWASFWALRLPQSQTMWRITKRNNELYKVLHTFYCSDFLARSPSQSNPMDLPALPKGEPLAVHISFIFCQGLSLWERCHRR